MIYADNAATTVLDYEAFEAMKSYLLEDYGNASQPYSFSRKSKKALKEAREQIACCINAEPEEIFFTSGGTESDNWVIKNFGAPSKKKHIITSQIEHHAILNACKHMVEMGARVDYLPVTREGVVLKNDLEQCLAVDRSLENEDTLVSIMLANNEVGTIEPITELAELSHKCGVLFHTDAVQVVGHMAIDVKKLGVDFLSASAHKFNGPKGIGFLYIRKGVKLRPLNDGGAQEMGFRAGTENVASVVAMAIALKNNCTHVDSVTKRLKEMELSFYKALDQSNINYIRNGSDNRVPGNISISIKDANGEMLLHRLDLKKICISTGSACDSKNTQVSHVIKAISVPNDYAEGTIRISFGKNNSDKDALFIAESLINILNG